MHVYAKKISQYMKSIGQSLGMCTNMARTQCARSVLCDRKIATVPTKHPIIYIYIVQNVSVSFSLYIQIHIYIYIYIWYTDAIWYYLYIYTYIIHVYIYIYTCTYTHKSIYLYIHIHSFIYIDRIVPCLIHLSVAYHHQRLIGAW